jgi:hypothetical protein
MEVSGEVEMKVDELPDAGSCGAGFAKTKASEMTVFPTEGKMKLDHTMKE